MLYRRSGGSIQVLLVHPGGPYWQKRDDGAWTIPKGEIGEHESALQVARREFQEELGMQPPQDGLISLGSVRQKAGKVVEAWAIAGDFEVSRLRSNTFEIEWPPRSGRMQTFPEVDRAEWFDLEAARRKLIAAQAQLIDRLEAVV
jgi:predicted NUDIX family NTP pyrophosphohydrolase